MMLPLGAAPSPADKRLAPLFAAAERGEATGAHPPVSVLIVEDDYFVALGLEQSLTDAGLNVVGVAVTAEEAIEMARRDQPDVAIVDVRLAGAKDGIEAAIELWVKHSIPSIFATAHGDAETKARAQKAEPLGWLIKPYSPDDAVAVIKAAVVKGSI